MKTNEQIIELLQRRQFDSARFSCIERLKTNRTDVQTWIFLGDTMVGLKRGKMAQLCYDRANIFDPYGSWVDNALSQASNVTLGHDDKQVLKLLEVPKVAVSACVLTRNNSQTIKECLQALQGAVDEIIVVDTGSTDDTIVIVESFGIIVRHFEWCDDFSAARNFAQSFITSDWVIMVDSDEILHPDDRDSIRIAAGILDTKADLLQIAQMNRINGAFSPYLVPRMFKASKFEWNQPIHEQLVLRPSAGDAKGINMQLVRIRLLHDGYDPTVVDIAEKTKRNLNLLRNAVEADPNNVAMNFHLGRDLFIAKNYEEAIIYLENAYRLGKEIEGQVLIPDICISLHKAYSALSRNEDAKEAAHRLTIDRPEHPDGWFYYGVAAANSFPSDIQKAAQLFTEAKRTASIYPGPSSFDPEIASWKANHMLGQLAQASGNLQEAYILFSEVLKVTPNNVDAINRLQDIERQIN